MSVDVAMHEPESVKFTHGDNPDVGWIDFKDAEGVEVTIFMNNRSNTLSLITQLRGVADDMAEWNARRLMKVDPAGVGEDDTPTDEE